MPSPLLASASRPSLLAQIAPAASPAYLSAELTLRRAEEMLFGGRGSGWSPLVWRALAVRCEAHMQELLVTAFVQGVGWRTGLAETQYRHLSSAARQARRLELGAAA